MGSQDGILLLQGLPLVDTPSVKTGFCDIHSLPEFHTSHLQLGCGLSHHRSLFTVKL